MADNKLYVVYDKAFGSMVRPEDGRIKPNDPNWSRPRLLERLDVPVELVDMQELKNPHPDAKAVWFALPDPQYMRVIRHYDHWQRNASCEHVLNHPFLTYRTKPEWYNFLNANGVRCPVPTYMKHSGDYNKTVFHGYGPIFSVEYIHSIGANPDETTKYPNRSKYHKVWRMVVFNGKCASKCARLEGDKFWIGTGCAPQFKDIVETPPEYVKICEKVAELSELAYFQIEIIPSPWVGPVVCDINPHSFDCMEGRLNDLVIDDINETLKGWLK